MVLRLFHISICIFLTLVLISLVINRQLLIQNVLQLLAFTLNCLLVSMESVGGVVWNHQHFTSGLEVEVPKPGASKICKVWSSL